MMNRILYIALLATCTQALQEHGATSSVSFNQHHNAIRHVQSAPALVKTIAPVHAAPLAIAAPAYANPYAQPSAYSSQTLGHGGIISRYSSPVSVAQHVLPSLQYASPVAKVTAPGLFGGTGAAHHASSYSSLALGHSTHVGHQGLGVAPFTRVLSPIAASPLHSAPALHVAPEVHAVPAVHGALHAPSHYEEYAHPKYEFAYGVEDHHTGDIHSHKEVRDGDVTQGEYSLHEADGTIRTVKYSVDKHSGFNAIVERSGHATHAQPAPLAATALLAAPSYGHYHH